MLYSSLIEYFVSGSPTKSRSLGGNPVKFSHLNLLIFQYYLAFRIFFDFCAVSGRPTK